MEINKHSVVILISDKIDFKADTVTREKEGRYRLLQGLIQQEDTIFGCI